MAFEWNLGMIFKEHRTLRYIAMQGVLHLGNSIVRAHWDMADGAGPGRVGNGKGVMGTIAKEKIGTK